MPTNMTNSVCSAFHRRLIPAGRLWSALSTILLAFQVGSRATQRARDGHSQPPQAATALQM